MAKQPFSKPYTAAKTIAVFFLAFGAVFLPLAAGAQEFIIQLPDCAVVPDDPFCVWECSVSVPRPDRCPDQNEARHPVLVVPGILASHNSKRILHDEAGGAWKYTPTAKAIYEPLVKRLEAEGFEQGKDLFVVFYDWRQPNKQSAIEYLKPAIDAALEKSDADQVDIVAHSMGGLVARAYAQSENLYRDDIDQIIMLGTPNLGAADAYTVWEGGKYPIGWNMLQRLWIDRIERLLKKTHQQNDLSRPLSFRTFFPSLQELIPIFTFIEKNGEEIEPQNLTDPNTFLEDLDNNSGRLSERGIRVTTIAGTGSPTLETIALRSPTAAEAASNQALSRWRDGHPDPDPPVAGDGTNGDQTVLLSSAAAVGDKHGQLNAGHSQLPGEAQKIVARELTGSAHGDFVASHLAQAAVGIDVMSPIMPKVTGPNGEELSFNRNTFPQADFDWDSDDPNGIKMLTIVDPPAGTYSVDLSGTATGDYTVVTSYADEDEQKEAERFGVAHPSEHITYTFTIKNDAFEPPQSYNVSGDNGGEDDSRSGGDSSGTVSSGDSRGDEQDCCPGRDAESPQKASAKKGSRVLGARTTKKPDMWVLLKPLNDLFFKVYNRLPVFSEWEYWAHRILTDKPRHVDLLGAMQWHKLHGIRH